MFSTLLLLTCATTQYGGNETSQVSLPLHGTVHKNTLYGFFGKERDYLLDAIPIKSPPKFRSLGYLTGLDGKKFQSPLKSGWKCYYLPDAPGIASGGYYRHQIKYDSIWISLANSTVSRLKFDELNLFDLSIKDFIEQYYKKYPIRKKGETDFHEISRLTSSKKYQECWFETEPRPMYGTMGNVLSYGSVATSDSSLKCYMLIKPTNTLKFGIPIFTGTIKSSVGKQLPTGRTW